MHGRHTMKRVNVHLPEQQISQLEKLSKRRGIGRAEIIRRAIDLYVWGATSGVKKTTPKRVRPEEDVT